MTDSNEYAEAHERFAQNLATAEQQAALEGRDPNTGLLPNQTHASQQPAPAVDAVMLAEADRLQSAVDPATGRRPYVEDDTYRQRVEQMRMAAFGAPPVGAPAQAQAPPDAAPIEPQGTPAERLEAEIRERIENNEVISPADYGDEMFREYAAGYDVADLLGSDYGLNAEHSAMLHAAREAGIPASQVRATIARMIKDQQ